MSGCDGVVSLSGAPVAGGRWTASRKRVLRDSRVGATATLVTAIAAAAAPPPVLLSGSAIGWYGDTGDREVDESAPAGRQLPGRAGHRLGSRRRPGPRRRQPGRALRTGLVLSPRRAACSAPLTPLFRLGLGARLGSGRQYLSWIALADHVRAARFLLEHDARRAGQPDRARAGHQRRVHRRAGPRRAPPGRARGAGAGCCGPPWASCRPSCSAASGSARPACWRPGSPSSTRPSTRRWPPRSASWPGAGCRPGPVVIGRRSRPARPRSRSHASPYRRRRSQGRGIGGAGAGAEPAPGPARAPGRARPR